MKKLLILLAILFSLAAFNPYEVEAATMITYDFTNYEIPEGQPKILEVDDSTIALWKTNPTYISQFVDALALKYNTPSAIINKTLEMTYLTGVINGTSLAGKHIPSYVSAVDNTLVSDNKASYVDVNITTQTLTVYTNGEATIITPIVTGNVKRGNDTPTGNFSVLYKQRDRTLIGPRNSYRSFVHYWMRIVNNVGIHDASWRSNFGGNIYLTNGSHGCINVPPVIMPSIYESVPLNTPVYVHK